jgi:hypothetical protein
MSGQLEVNNEPNVSNVANPSIEFVMCSVDDMKDFQVPAILKLLQDPCIRIIDI